MSKWQFLNAAHLTSRAPITAELHLKVLGTLYVHAYWFNRKEQITYLMCIQSDFIFLKAKDRDGGLLLHFFFV